MDYFWSFEPDDFWPYQVGTPGNLPSPPYNWTAARKHERPQESKFIASEIHGLCEDLGILVYSLVFMWRWNDVPDSQKELVLLISAEWEDDGTKLAVWKQVCCEAYDLLCEKDYDDLKVHIVDAQKVETAWPFPAISADAPIIHSWESIRREIHDILAQDSWHTITVYGQKSDPAKPTIVISVWDPRPSLWLQRKERIKTICQSHGIEADVVTIQAYNVSW